MLNKQTYFLNNFNYSIMLLSIVIPVYNSSKYLDDCLGSLLDQDLSRNDYEIICVNDGSTDNSRDILKQYAKLNQNIKLINQENKGHSAARNAGLKAAIGKYIWFVDSDDFVDENSMLSIVNCMEKNEIDFLTIGLRNVSNDAHFTSSNKKTDIFFYKQPHNFACSGNRIILRDILTQNNIFWSNEVYSLDDVLFLFYVQLYAKKGAYTGSIFYYYRESPNSITRTKSRENTIKHINALRKLIENFQIELIRQKKKSAEVSVINNINERISLAIKSMLFEAIFVYNFKESKKLLEELKSNNYYPYKLILYDLRPKVSLKRTLMDWSMLFFPVEIYYLSYSFILRKLMSYKI